MKRKDKNPFVPSSESELIDRYISQLEQKEKATRTVKFKPRYKRRHRFLLPFSLCLVALVAVFALFYFKVIPSPEELFLGEDTPAQSFEIESNISSDSLLDNTEESEAEKSPAALNRPSKIYGVTLEEDKDFKLADAGNEFVSISSDLQQKGFTAAFIKLNSPSGLITDTKEGKNAIESAAKATHEKAITLYGIVDVKELVKNDPTNSQSVLTINNKLEELCNIEGLDGIMTTGVEKENADTDFREYIATGSLGGFDNYRKNRLTSLVKKMGDTVRNTNDSLLFGLVCDDVYTTNQTSESKMDVKSDTELLKDKNADVLDWMEKAYFDIVFVRADTPTTSKDKPFETVAKWWDDKAPASCDLAFMLSSSLAGEGKGDWSNPDQLGRQLSILNDLGRFTFCFDSYSALNSDHSGGAELVYKYLLGGISEDYIMRELSITSPQKTDYQSFEKTTQIIGASDPNFPLLLNGEEVKRTKDGYFSLDLDLKVGKNTFTFTHKGTTKTYNVTYRYVVIKDYSPSSALKLDGGSSIIVKATARTGSTVKATLNGKTITLQLTEGEQDSAFSTYSGGITLPAGESKDKNLGKIKFTGTHNGVTENFTGGSITIKKKKIIPSSKPTSTGGSNQGGGSSNQGGGSYAGVGNNLIAEVVKYQTETFDGDVLNDLSQPYNNYLPKGTVDYCSENTIYDTGSGNSYRLLRYGKRVYTSSSNIKTYKGTLPSKNSISLKSLTTSGSRTKLTLKTTWKAPFKLEYLPQKYQAKTGSARGTITSATFNYIEITFCYASSLSGSFGDISSSPVFSRAQIIKNTSDYTLRLYLKKTGYFYGWTANYDSSGNLVFEFLNPAKATKANNAYGGRLDSITIAIDAGHGGSDPGAVGAVASLNEANRNLLLAQKVKSKLESIGAKVVMTRTSNTSLTSDQRILKVKNAKPNLAVSIHRNSSTSSSANGFGAYYFNPYTKLAADKIKNATADKNAYKREFTSWHVFYMSRISDCPVVLTENGFMSNSTDFGNMKSDAWNDKCADAIVEGIVDYFLAIG